MLGTAGWIAFGTLALYLLLFFWGTAEAGRSAGRRVWLFGMARGRARLAASGFRLAFALAFAGPLLGLALAGRQHADPLWSDGQMAGLGLAGALLAVAGAMIAFAAQMSMGASWRVGVAQGETGALVTGGLYRVSRNPTFAGQALLLTGVALAVPAIATLAAPLLFLWSATIQIRDEEQALAAAHPQAWADWAGSVPRWIGPVAR